MTKNNFWKLVVSIATCQGAGVVGTLFTVPAIAGWYQFLNKPVFSPPNWLFGPVWITLYTLMGISFYLIWLSPSVASKKRRRAMAFFVAHLFVNASWSIVFFGLHNIALAFAVILVLLVMIVVLIKLFRPINRLASNLLIPYLVWVSVATVLNYSLMVLN